MNPLITDLEQYLGLGAVKTAKVLGYPYSTYAQYKNGNRPVKRYLYLHITAIMRLPKESLTDYVLEALNDKSER